MAPTWRYSVPFPFPHLCSLLARVWPTAGKGSTVALIASALRAAGHRVGVYTSPHLHHIAERISTEAGLHIQPEAFDVLVRALL